MHKPKLLISSALFLTIFFFSVSAFSQTPPASQTAGGIVRQETQRLKQKRLEEKLEKERAKTEAVSPDDVVTPDQGPTTLVNKIVVEGATLLSAAEIKNIVSQYEGSKLTIDGMQKVADLITDEYRRKGFVTSRAYIPPQTIAEGVLIIKVVEGKLGTLNIKGNRYFSSALLEKNIDIKPDGNISNEQKRKKGVWL